jgi:Sulfotransferase family
VALPDFLIVGAPKAGSTALHEALVAHPDLFLSPVKEPKFFLCDGRPRAQRGPGDAHSVHEWVWRRDRYERLFDAAPPGSLKGESTPFYLWDRPAHVRIRALVPDVKLIAVLRDPVDRAYSNWTHLWCDGLEPEADFFTACDKEEARARAGWAPFWRYLGLGRYGEQLEHLLSCFDPSQVHLLRYRELVDDPSGTLDRICRFLGVRDGLLSGAPSSNVSAWVEPTVRNQVLRSAVRAGAYAARFAPPQAWRAASAPLLRALQRGGGHRPPLDPQVRLALVERFRDDVATLERLTGGTYSDWLGPVGRGTYSVRKS